MIVKVKHTKNGNVKITMTLEQAEYLRSGLIKAAYEGNNCEPMLKEILLNIDDQLAHAGVSF
jgi:hypothetical protein